MIEPATIEGKLADLIEVSEVRIDGYRMSAADKLTVVRALRWAASATTDGCKSRVDGKHLWIALPVNQNGHLDTTASGTGAARTFCQYCLIRKPE